MAQDYDFESEGVQKLIEEKYRTHFGNEAALQLQKNNLNYVVILLIVLFIGLVGFTCYHIL